MGVVSSGWGWVGEGRGRGGEFNHVDRRAK